MSVESIALLLVGVLTLLNSIAVIGLIRQVGLLHIRVSPVPAMESAEGPQRGDLLSLGAALPALQTSFASAQRFVFGCISPTCSLCGPLLPGFKNLHESREGEEAIILVADVEEKRAQEYVGDKNIGLFTIGEPNLFRDNHIPGTPYVVVTDRDGIVLSAGAVNTLEQVEWLLDRSKEDLGQEGGEQTPRARQIVTLERSV